MLAAVAIIAFYMLWATVSLYKLTSDEFFEGKELTVKQTAQVQNAINTIRSAAGGKYARYADRAQKIRFRSTTIDDWAKTLFTYRKVIIDNNAFDLDDRNFAALIMHETVHTMQAAVYGRGIGGRLSWVYLDGEHGAYQVESDFMTDIGWFGTANSLVAQCADINGMDNLWLNDQADSMSENYVDNPAVTF